MSIGIQVLRERCMGVKGLKSIAITINTTFAQSLFFSNALKITKIDVIQVIHLKRI
ncbi:hypothetical protein ES705_51008 [subsurface metagenome]